MEMRPATRDEFDAFSVAALSAFHRVYTDHDGERYGHIDEPERSLAWFDEGRIVATTSAFTRALTVPGAGSPLRAGLAGELVEAMRAVHDRVRVDRPGMLDRPGPWWGDRLNDPESERHGAQPLQAVTVADGYALYAVRPEWGDEGPAGDVGIRELVAATPQARARLWAYLLDQDLTKTISWRLAPVDEPLWLMLTDPRAVRTVVVDALWVRLVDVAAALSARTYATDPDVVIEVADEFCAWNAGRYRLAGGSCTRGADAPDLALDVSALASAYLGGTTLLTLASAGRVRELTPGAVARA